MTKIRNAVLRVTGGHALEALDDATQRQVAKAAVSAAGEHYFVDTFDRVELRQLAARLREGNQDAIDQALGQAFGVPRREQVEQALEDLACRREELVAVTRNPTEFEALKVKLPDFRARVSALLLLVEAYAAACDDRNERRLLGQRVALLAEGCLTLLASRWLQKNLTETLVDAPLAARAGTVHRLLSNDVEQGVLALVRGSWRLPWRITKVS